MFTHGKRRLVSLFLFSALLTFCIAAFIPTATAAGTDKIADFCYQTPSNFRIGAADTALRFVFTVDSLEYDEAGVVFSKTVSEPTYEGENCGTFKTTTVYSAINADGELCPALGGRWWVAVKLDGIPLTAYNSPVYARAFVKSGVSVEYSDPRAITVWQANQIDGKFREDVWTDDSSGTAGVGLPLSENQEYGTTPVLNDGKHFYPTSENPSGNDLLIEYTVLWNPTQLYLDPSSGPSVASLIGKQDGTKSQTLVRWNPATGVDSAYCPYAGGFEPGAFEDMTDNDEINAYPGMCDYDGEYGDYPNLGGADQANPEWGWHRIGVRVSQILTNEEDVRDWGEDAEYDVVITTYLDGNPISQFHGEFGNAGNYLYTAESDGMGGIICSDIEEDRWVFIYRYSETSAQIGQTVYSMIGEYSATAGRNFLQNVRRVNAPAAVSYTTSDGANTFSARVWFTID